MKNLFSTLAVAFLLFVCGGCDSADVSSTAGRLAVEDAVFFGNKVDVHGSRVIVGTRSASVYIFQRTAENWARQTRFDNLGTESVATVALSDSYAFAGTPDDANGHGALHIFKQDGNGWSRQTAFYAERELGNSLGRDIAVKGDRLVVSASNKQIADERYAGAAYVLELEGEEWTQVAKLTANPPKRDARLGLSAGLSRNTVILGAWGEDAEGSKDVGAAYVFQRNGGSWAQATRLTASDAAPRARFGESVAIDGSFALVSSSADSVQGEDFVGTIYAHERMGGTWVSQDQIRGSDTDHRDHFGAVVDLSPSGDYLISQSIYKDEGRGAAYVFHRQPSGQWQQQAKLTAPTRRKSAFFGEDVAITDRYAVVGAPGENGEQGAVYVFERNGANWTLAD